MKIDDLYNFEKDYKEFMLSYNWGLRIFSDGLDKWTMCQYQLDNTFYFHEFNIECKEIFDVVVGGYTFYSILEFMKENKKKTCLLDFEPYTWKIHHPDVEFSNFALKLHLKDEKGHRIL